MAPGQWDADHDRNLLLLLLGPDTGISRARFDELATKMTNGVSGNACRQRFYKLKKESEALTAGTATATAANSTTASASTPAIGTPKKSRAAPGTSARKRKNGTTNGDGNANDGDNDNGSPVKKPKTATSAKKKAATTTEAAATAAEEGAGGEDEVVKVENDDGKSDITVNAEAEENAVATVAGDDD